MSAQVLSAGIAGIGFWTRGLPSWDAARAFIADGSLPADPPARPSPQLLAPNERRRAPETVAVALEVALAACADAGDTGAEYLRAHTRPKTSDELLPPKPKELFIA